MELKVSGVSKAFGAERVLVGVSLRAESGKTLAVLGKSGGGKTTLLKIIAGLIDADSGSIVLGGRELTRTPPQQRNIVYLYQEPLLFPHLTAEANLGFALRLRKVHGKEIRARVAPIVEELELIGSEKKFPHQLSGGQRQRVSFGRALIAEPAMLLLDEPFGALDSITREAMQKFFGTIAARHGITSIFVTHSVKEALIVGDHVAVLKDGTLTQYETRESFVKDPSSGVAEEIRFWNTLRHE